MKHKYIHYRGSKAKVVMGKYQNNGRLAVMLQYGKDPLNAAYPITVNINDGLDMEEEYAYLDTNNYPGIEECILELGLAFPTGMYGCSGFCRYPLYKFDLSKIPEVKGE